MFANSFRSRAPSAPEERDSLPPGLLLGWNKGTEPESIGFGPRSVPSNAGSDVVTYDGDAPLLTCGPTSSGKGRSVVITNALTYPGPLNLVDIKGELYKVTSRRRREMGQQVVALDPFHLVTTKSDSLNPLDLMTLPRSDVESDAEMLASLLAVGNEFRDDPYWTTMANGLVAAIIAESVNFSPKDRHLGQIRAWLHHRDPEMAIAEMLDKNIIRSRMAREQFIAYLNAPADRTRPCIKATACSHVSVLGSEQVLQTLRSSSFRLKDVYDGKPLTIYIVIPPDKLESHKALLRLWVTTLLTTIVRRPAMPRQRTLFLIDECAQLGTLPILRQAITLLRGSGLQTWTFWQDLSQLRQYYPNDWQTILHNSGVLQVLGITNHSMAKEWSDLLGHPAQELQQLAPQDTVVHRQGQGSQVCRRLDYLKDAMFAGLFDANPRFALQGQAR